MDEMNIIIVHYVDVRHCSDIGINEGDYMRQVVQSCSDHMIRDGVERYFVPVHQDSRVECINPKLVDKIAFKEAKILLEEHQVLLKKSIQNLKNKIDE